MSIYFHEFFATLDFETFYMYFSSIVFFFFLSVRLYWYDSFAVEYLIHYIHENVYYQDRYINDLCFFKALFLFCGISFICLVIPRKNIILFCFKNYIIYIYKAYIYIYIKPFKNLCVISLFIFNDNLEIKF